MRKTLVVAHVTRARGAAAELSRGEGGRHVVVHRSELPAAAEGDARPPFGGAAEAPRGRAVAGGGRGDGGEAAEAGGGMRASLRVLVDRSIVESFADGGAASHSTHRDRVAHGDASTGIRAVARTPPSSDRSGGAAAGRGDGGAGGGGVGGGSPRCTFERLVAFPMAPFVYDTSLCAESGRCL